MICIAGVLMLLCGCVPAAVKTAQSPEPVISETGLSAAPAVEETRSVETGTNTPVIAINRESTETPYVWIENSTVVPDTPVPPVYSSFTPTSTPTITLTPTKGPSPLITRTPTATATVTATSNPPVGALIIRQPGPASKVTSPFEITAAITRGEDRLVHLSLIGENSQTFYSEVLDYRKSEYNRLLITPLISYDMTRVAENARLVLLTYDLQGRIMALTSVDILLLSIGRKDIKPAERNYTSLIIDTPDDGDEISGGRLVVSGRAAPLNKNPVLIELLDENGAVLAKCELNLEKPLPDETYTHFVIDLDYSVVRQTLARLVIRQESDNRIQGTIALSSAAVTLLP